MEQKPSEHVKRKKQENLKRALVVPKEGGNRRRSY